MKAIKNKMAVILYLSIPLCSVLYQSIIGSRELVIAVLLVSIVISLDGLKITVLKENIYWLSFIIAIIPSLTQRDITSRVLAELTICFLFILFLILVPCSWSSIKCGYNFIFIFGIINAIAIILQYILRERFNDIVFSHFTEYAKNYVRLYYRSGYFMGFNHVPGTSAGVITFTIGMIVLDYILKYRNRGKKRFLLLLFILIYSLLLTQKKGILFVTIATLFFLYYNLIGTKRRIVSLLVLMFLCPIVYFSFENVLSIISNKEIFYRLSSFFQQIETGKNYDSGRLLLFENAISIWKTKPIFGIGWLKFSEYTTTLLGYKNAHYVNLDYLQFLCETGIVGFILSIFPIIITLYKTIKVLSRFNVINSNIPASVVVYSIFIQIFTVIYAFLEIPFFDRTFFLPIYIFSTICISKCYSELSYAERISL